MNATNLRHLVKRPDVFIRYERGKWIVEENGRFLFARELQTDAIDCALDHALIAGGPDRPHRVLLQTAGGWVLPIAGTPSPTYGTAKVVDFAEARRKRQAATATVDERRNTG
jgi:hypothetical protein